MSQFLTIIIVIAAIVLTFVVLIQNSKGGGLAAGFASANQVFGVRKTTDRIEKLTWILIGAIVVLSIFSSRLISNAKGGAPVTEITAPPTQSAEQQQQVPTAQPFEQGAAEEN
jgi:preprotein translocase subunit SecG